MLLGFGPKWSRTDPLREQLKNNSRHDVAAAAVEDFIICVQLNGGIFTTGKKKREGEKKKRFVYYVAL